MNDHVSHEAAAEALNSLDDYARMGTGVDAHGPRGMLERYIAQQAATLRQSADSGRVGDDPLVAEGLAYFERVGDAGDKLYVKAIRAALAAQGQGERCKPCGGMGNIMDMRCIACDGKGRTHPAPAASPAGVPDADVRWLLAQLRHNEFSHDYIKDEQRCDMCKRIKSIAAKLSAPSAPEGDGHE